MTNLAPSWRPKRLPNRGQDAKKSMLETNTFLASIFEGFGPRFGRGFGRFFGPKMDENCENAILAKRLKLLIFLMENWYFQGFEVLSFETCNRNCAQKSHVFWDIDLEGFWEGFWKGFGKVCRLIKLSEKTLRKMEARADQVLIVTFGRYLI